MVGIYRVISRCRTTPGITLNALHRVVEVNRKPFWVRRTSMLRSAHSSYRDSIGCAINAEKTLLLDKVCAFLESEERNLGEDLLVGGR